MIYRQCKFCSECLKNYPEEIALTIYPVTMPHCPRCRDPVFAEIETDAWPKYLGAPAQPKEKPQRQLF